MKIKRFFASEMREAIRQVKEELGADAVILSNNKIDGGIELVAAIDYDEDAVKRSCDTKSELKKTSPQKTLTQKKKAVFSKLRRQKTTDKLEDAIEDDIINFSHQHKSTQQPSAQSNSFAAILKRSNTTQAAGTKQQVNEASLNHENREAYSKPSLQDRKQPYISEFYGNNDADNVSQEDIYPFDYESLVGDEINKTRAKQSTGKQKQAWNMDDFYSDGVHASDKNRPARTGKTSPGGKKQVNKKKVEWVADPALVSMKEEIKSLRGILENQLSGLAWGDFARSHPHHAELLSRLYRLGIKSSLSEKLVKRLKTCDSLEDSWRALLSIISRNIPMIDSDLIDEGGIIALVGPTGVGKTTNIAKMAARYTLKYGSKNLALVTTDSYRVGAHEQLKTYGRILGVPVYVADNENELKQVLSRLDDKQLILIDTAGMSHRDLRLAQQLSMLRQSHNKMKILAVLSAASQSLAMDEIIKAFNASELDGCIASKVDESTSIGGIISVLIENQLQLSYISDGQKVPEDLHLANATDLLKQALGMVREHPVQIKTDELAMSYSGGGLAHAFA